jgi:hypothetical protein
VKAGRFIELFVCGPTTDKELSVNTSDGFMIEVVLSARKNIWEMNGDSHDFAILAASAYFMA